MEEVVHVYSQNKLNGSSIVHKSWHSLESSARKCNASNCHVYDASLSPGRSWERSLYYVLVFANAFFHYWFTVYCLSWAYLDLLNINSICRNRRTRCFPKKWGELLPGNQSRSNRLISIPKLFPKQKVSTLLLTFSAKPNKMSVIAAQGNDLFLVRIVSFKIQTAFKLSLSADGVTLDFPESNTAHCSCEDIQNV